MLFLDLVWEAGLLKSPRGRAVPPEPPRGKTDLRPVESYHCDFLFFLCYLLSAICYFIH